MAIPLLPLSQRRHQPPDILFVANEVVVHDEDGAAPAQTQEGIKLGEYLLIALGSWYAPVDFDDVAEFAIEWTTARVLDRHRAIALHVCEMKVGNRRC